MKQKKVILLSFLLHQSSRLVQCHLVYKEFKIKDETKLKQLLYLYVLDEAHSPSPFRLLIFTLGSSTVTENNVEMAKSMAVKSTSKDQNAPVIDLNSYLFFFLIFQFTSVLHKYDYCIIFINCAYNETGIRKYHCFNK